MTEIFLLEIASIMMKISIISFVACLILDRMGKESCGVAFFIADISAVLCVVTLLIARLLAN